MKYGGFIACDCFDKWMREELSPFGKLLVRVKVPTLRIENGQPPATLSFVQTHVMGSNETYVPYRNVNSIDEDECVSWQLNNKYKAHHNAHQIQVDSSDFPVIHVLFDDLRR